MEVDHHRKLVTNQISQLLSNFNILVQTLSLQRDEVQKTSLELTQDSVMLKRATRSIEASVEQLLQTTASLKQLNLSHNEALVQRMARLKKRKQKRLIEYKKVFAKFLAELEELEYEIIKNI